MRCRKRNQQPKAQVSMENVDSDLMQHLGKHYGLDSVTMTEENSCTLIINGFHVIFVYFEKGEQLLLAAPIGDLPTENREHLLLRLLQAQFFFDKTGGATLAVDPEGQFVSIQVVLPLQIVTFDNIAVIAEGFVRTAEHWHAIICPDEAHASQENNEAHQASGEGSPADMMAEGMLKI